MKKIFLDILKEVGKKPPIYTQSTASLWDDEHISRGMLKAHLDPNFEGASRKHSFIDKSFNWIVNYTDLKRNSKILDLGCGPGLYAERFAKLGYKVTGVDFSKRSISYARKQATEKGLDITYLYQDYQTLDFKDKFNVSILIYCDFGVLSDIQRSILLAKIYEALGEGGKLIFDVFTPLNYANIDNKNTWEYHEDGGFWRPGAHLCLTSHFTYQEMDTYLEQVIVFDESEKVEVYRLWNRTYTCDSIQKLLNRSGFKVIDFFSNVAGEEYRDDSTTLCVVAEKL